LDRADAEMERQFAQRAFDAAQTDQADNRPPARAYLIATAVHLSTLGIGALGAWLVARVFIEPNIAWLGVALSLIFGIGLLLIAFTVQPVLQRHKSGLERAAHPALFDLADQLADEMGRPPLRSLRVDGSFNIGSARVGLPLLAMLDAQAFAAALALAIARRDADAATQGWVASAAETLHRWERILSAPGSGGQRMALRAGLTTVVETSRANADPLEGMLDALVRRLAAVPRAVAAALMRDNWQQTQVALYQVDALAARAAGSDALASALVQMRWDYIAIGVMHKAVQKGLRRADGLFDALRAGLAGVPEREHERVRRTAALEETMAERGEPPLGWRLRRLHTLNASPHVTCDAARLVAIRESLRLVEPVIARQLFEELR
jgi:hypothetical protein